MKTKIIILSLIAVIAFVLRVVPHWSDIFIAKDVVFNIDTDSYYHMRLVDSLISNFPHGLSWDYYSIYPDGSLPYFRPMLSFIIASLSLLFGLGHPSSQLVNTVGAFVPPVLGVIAVFLSFWLARVTFKSAFIAYVGALLVAIFPTELLHRSMLGYTDHHILEVVFGLITLICVIKFDITKKLKWSLAGGISLAALHYTWSGAPLWGGIIFTWFVIAFMYRYWKRGYDDDLKKLAGGIALMYALCLTLIVPLIPASQTNTEIFMAAYPLAAFFFMAVASRIKAKYGLPVFIGTAGIGLLVLVFAFPQMIAPIQYQFKSVFWGFGSTILEAMPSDLGMIYYFFSIAAVFAVIGLIIAIKKQEHGLFITWAVVFCIAMIGQRRWAYVATVPIVLLAAYGVIKIASVFTPFIKWVAAFTAVFVIICATIPAQLGMMNVRTDITPAWYNACTWLRANSPEPIVQKVAGYAFVGGGVALDPISYYEADYAVLSWWDYGHFIIRIGHRVPMANPAMQINVPAFRFLLAQSDEEAEAWPEAKNVKYIMIDDYMINPGNKDGAGTKFYAMVMQAAIPGVTNWRDVLPNSLVNRLYQNGETEHYFEVYESGDVKVFERKEAN